MKDHFKDGKITYRRVSLEELQIGANVAVFELKEALLHCMLGLYAVVGKEVFLEVAEETTNTAVSLGDKAAKAGEMAVKDAQNTFHRRKTSP